MNQDVIDKLSEYFRERAHWAAKNRDEAIRNNDEKMIELYSQLVNHYEGIFRQMEAIR